MRESGGQHGYWKAPLVVARCSVWIVALPQAPEVKRRHCHSCEASKVGFCCIWKILVSVELLSRMVAAVSAISREDSDVIVCEKVTSTSASNCFLTDTVAPTEKELPVEVSKALFTVELVSSSELVE
jgi:hypothetical protein